MTINVSGVGFCAINDGVGVSVTIKYPGGVVAGSGTVASQPTGNPRYSWSGSGPTGFYNIKATASSGVQVKTTGAIAGSTTWNLSIGCTAGIFNTSFTAYPNTMNVNMQFAFDGSCGYEYYNGSNSWTVKTYPGLVLISSGSGSGTKGLPWPTGAANYPQVKVESDPVAGTGSDPSPSYPTTVTCGSSIGCGFYADVSHLPVVMPGYAAFMPMSVSCSDSTYSGTLDGVIPTSGNPYYLGTIHTGRSYYLYPCDSWKIVRVQDNATGYGTATSGSSSVTITGTLSDGTAMTIYGTV